jgi:large subunit ribosomal protein L13
MKTTQSFQPDTVVRQWHVVDLAGVRLGRAAARIAAILRGKHKPTYTPHADCGDFVVVINAAKLELSGNKLDTKLYRRHTGYMGGLRTRTAREMIAKKPAEVVEIAVKGMLPKGPLGRRMWRKLKVYAGAEHPHQAQQPQPLDLNV